MRGNDKKYRIQEGIIHVYFRGNNQRNVFYDDVDKIEFLKCCEKAANRYDTRILEFALMNNHVHLQVETKRVTPFMKGLLLIYVPWYNKRKGSRDKLFKTPFNSACKFTERWIIDNSLYIIQNPLKAEICKEASDFKWSSYGFHFNGRPPLRKYINVDTSFIDDFFKTRHFFDKAIMEKYISVKEVEEFETENSVRITTEELILLSDKFTEGKNIFRLKMEEISNLVKYLHEETNASFRQIASVTQEHYDTVRRICSQNARS